MTDAAEPELFAQAQRQHIIVIGGGVSGLIAARECAKVGMHVTLLEARDALGGVVQRAELDGIAIDAGAESFATRGGSVRTLISELGLADQIVKPRVGGAWLAGIPNVGAAPLPKGGVLGIPANPFAEDVRAIIGWRGAWRAYLDRLRPPLTIGHTQSLGALVRSRMGQRVLDRLVTPVTSGVYSAHPDAIDVEAAAPGLSTALTRMGSLSGAVFDLVSAREEGASKAPGAAVAGIRGGMFTLVDALRRELDGLGVEIRTGCAVSAVARTATGWDVRVPGDEGDETLTATGLVIATEEDAARTLLEQHTTLPAAAGQAPQIELVSMLLKAPQLDSAPRGTGALTVPGAFQAKALTHSTAKWDWLADETGGRHVVRVSFGSQGEAPATAELDDDAAARLALSEASEIFGVALPASTLIAAHRSRYTQGQPASLIGAAKRRTAVRHAVINTPGLAVVGAWVAGTGLAQVIPDAQKEADRLRRQLLWGNEQKP